MTPDDYVVLLIQARLVLERYLFDGVDLRADVAEICAQIEDARPPAADVHPPTALPRTERAAHRPRHLASSDRTTCSRFCMAYSSGVCRAAIVIVKQNVWPVASFG